MAGRGLQLESGPRCLIPALLPTRCVAVFPVHSGPLSLTGLGLVLPEHLPAPLFENTFAVEVGLNTLNNSTNKPWSGSVLITSVFSSVGVRRVVNLTHGDEDSGRCRLDQAEESFMRNVICVVFSHSMQDFPRAFITP